MSPENETFIIPAHPPLCEEMKLYNILDQPMQGELGEISEWAARKALWDYPIGSEQSVADISERALTIQFGLVLSNMHDLGLVDMEWCEEHGEFTWSLTPGGKELGAQMP
tara:strand:+ start:21 stop:350 length:330 start_codon:yes stop_codon:yes gene_type:complete